MLNAHRPRPVELNPLVLRPHHHPHLVHTDSPSPSAFRQVPMPSSRPNVSSAHARLSDAEAEEMDDLSPPSAPAYREAHLRLSIAFFAFGLLNNVVYVIILTAALDLVPPDVPKGLVAFMNIFPALVAKAVWPYMLTGKIRYARRVLGCTLLSFGGMVIIAAFDSLLLRLLGIGIASFSSGLGELTCLQLSTTYSSTAAGTAVGWFASGTGAAGLVGAAAWWLVRGLGVRRGLAILSFLPFCMSIDYFLALPPPSSVISTAPANYVALPTGDANAHDPRLPPSSPVLASRPILSAPHPYSLREDVLRSRLDLRDSVNARRRDEEQPSVRDGEGAGEEAEVAEAEAEAEPGEEGDVGEGLEEEEGEDLGEMLDVYDSEKQKKWGLSVQDKWDLVKPLLLPYVLPLVLVYLFEYTINQGVAPTLIYPVPGDEHLLLKHLVHSLRDWYPLYQLDYQIFVFFARSSVSLFRLPALPTEFIPIPAIVQGIIFLLLTTESAASWFRPSIAPSLAIVLVAAEGICGGLAYVSVFYQIGVAGHDEDEEDEEDEDGVAEPRPPQPGRRPGRRRQRKSPSRLAQEREFRIGSIGVGDSAGILLASLCSMPLEIWLCNVQVARGRTLCKEL